MNRSHVPDRQRPAAAAAIALTLMIVVPAVADAQSAQPPRGSAALRELSDTFEALASRVRTAVVQILATGTVPNFATDDPASDALLSTRRTGGSGVILDASGYIVTNAHVVDGAERIRVVLPPTSAPDRRSIVKPRGRTVEARLVGLDRETDLAVLKVEASGLATLQFSDSDELRPGQLVFAFGSPLGLDDSVSMGVVSAVGRQRRPDDPMVFVQTDAPINQGSSGGPLVDTDGRLVGINTFMLSQSGGSDGLGFAAPSNIVQTVYEQITRTGRVRRGTIGVRAQTITPELAAGLSLPQDWGVILGDVLPASTAESAGLRAGDVVLTLDGKVMENGRQLDVNLYRRSVGETVTMEIMRGGRRSKEFVAVAERQDDPDRFARMVSRERNLIARLGILAIEVTDDLAPFLPARRAPGGVVVASRAVAALDPLADLAAGDIIYAVNGAPIAGLDALRQAVAKLRTGSACVLQVQRGLELRFVAFEIE